MPRTPEIAVVVPSHDRPLRLRWLLNALEEQTLDRQRFEIVVGHDSSDPETEQLLRTHPLATAGPLRHVALRPGSAPPGANRNAAWRAARAPLIAFTDDDCRPPPEWLEIALRAAERHPGAIVQGRTAPDPHEAFLRHAAAHSTTQDIHPPVPWAQGCNIVYPRAVLERAEGFEEEVMSGEDADLAARARKSGVPFVGAPEMLTYHAVEWTTLPRRVAAVRKWRDLPWLVKRHPELRRHFFARLFWRPEHVWLVLGFAGAALGRRRPVLALLALPWVVRRRPHYGRGARGLLRSLSELPSRALIDMTEIAALARGSARHRTLFL